MNTGAKLGLVALGILGMVACGLSAERENWTDQLHADSPCYRVDLLDGLDESSTAEVRDLYGCVNNGGQFSSFSPAVDGLESTTRDGEAAGIDVARAVNLMPDAGVDPFALAGVALDLLGSDEAPVEGWLDVGLELIYGHTAQEVWQGDVTLSDPSEGVLVPLGGPLRVASAAMLDSDLELADLAADIAGSAETKRYVRTFEGLAASEDPRVSVPARELLPQIGELILSTRSPGNDRDGRASGDSLRDAIAEFTTGPAIEDISGPAAAILADDRTRPALVARIGQWQADGHLDDLDRELAWMASVDVDGGSLTTGEPTGLHSLVRLLSATNRPMSCSFDLWVTNLDIDLGNMAVTILDTLAGANPDTLRSGLGILGGILDWNISQSILDDVAESGVCPVITSQVVHDLGALDLIQHDEMNDTLVVFLDALSVLKGRGGSESRIPDLADLATALEEDDTVWAVEELVRDIDGQPGIATFVELVPVLIDPADYGIRAGDEPAATLDDMLGLVVWVFEAGDDGRTGWERSRDLVRPIVEEEGTWRAVNAFALVVSQDDSALAGILDLLGPTLRADPDLVTIDQLGPLLRERDLARPVLRILETPEVIDAVFATDPVDGNDPPIGFIGRLIADGTVDEALRTIDLVVDAFDGLLGTDETDAAE